MEAIENRMVVGWQWPEEPSEVRKKLNMDGYREMGTDIFVPNEDAFDYALEHCVCWTHCPPQMLHGIDWVQEFKEMLVEWFYSGNWVREE